MKILCAADVSIHRVIGGAERVLFEQAVRLGFRGHQIHVLTRRLPEHALDQETIQGVQEWRYAVDNGSALSYLRSTLKNGRHLFEALERDNHFDAIVFHQPFSAYALIRSQASQLIPKIYLSHSLAFEEYQSRNPATGGFLDRVKHGLNIQVRKHIERRAISAADPIVVLSRYTQEKLWNAYRIAAERIHIIPGGVDLEHFCPAPDRDMLRARFGFSGGDIVLLTVRNLVPRMGLENLIRAMQDVLTKIPEAQLIIGGNGPLKGALMSLAHSLGIENKIHFPGFIAESDLPDFYRMADLFILPTWELEGFGLVTVEALACGIPVLGTPVGGTLEILTDLNPDFLFKGTDQAALAERIISTCGRMKSEVQFREKVSMQCRKFVEEHYAWERNISEMERVLSEAVAKGGS